MYEIGAPPKEDIKVLEGFYKEFYKRFAPSLIYKILLKDQIQVDELYQEFETASAVYTVASAPLFFTMEPEEQELEKYGIDKKHEVTFTGCLPIFDDLGIVPKEGDVVEHSGLEYEVLTYKRKSESYFAHSDVCFEIVLVTKRCESGR